MILERASAPALPCSISASVILVKPEMSRNSPTASKEPEGVPAASASAIGWGMKFVTRGSYLFRSRRAIAKMTDAKSPPPILEEALKGSDCNTATSGVGFFDVRDDPGLCDVQISNRLAESTRDIGCGGGLALYRDASPAPFQYQVDFISG